MKKEFTLSFPVTVAPETTDEEMLRQLTQALNAQKKRLDSAGLTIGRMTVTRVAAVADPDADEFQCEDCGLIADIDDSIKTTEGALLCERCHGKNLGLKRCPTCQANLTLTDSVSREYVDKDGGESAHSLGLYMPDGSFEPTSAPDLSGGRYDLSDDSDRCATCGDKV